MLAACKVTCATTLYREGFSDQLIKERTGHRSLEALHQYKRTGSQQQQDLSMALGPSISGMKPNFDKENVKPKCDSDDDDCAPEKESKATARNRCTHIGDVSSFMHEPVYIHLH